MPGENEAAVETAEDKVGSVSANRYAEIVAELRELVKTASGVMFKIGDYALEIEPMREHGGSVPADVLFTVKDSLFRLAEDIGMSYYTVRQARQVASKWPKDRRAAEVSYTVHSVLASIADDDERFAAILTPPPGKPRWTPDEAKRRTGRQVAKPVTPQEKISAIHTLAGRGGRRDGDRGPAAAPGRGRPGRARGQGEGGGGAVPRGRRRRCDRPGHPAPSCGCREGHPG
jgi:hypothetical protein